MRIDATEASALSRLFSATVLRDFGKQASSPLFCRLIMQTRIASQMTSGATVGSAFNQAFETLNKSGSRDDYIYRSAITEKILLGRHNLNSATQLSEVRAGSSKADLVVLNGTSTAYEIKSDRDSLARLNNQIENYRQVFASVSVVVSKSHMLNVINSTPDDVGVIALSERYRLQTVREAKNRPERTVPSTILETLRIDEAKEILRGLQQDVPQVPNTLIRSEIAKIFTSLDPVAVHKEMTKTLKKSRSQANLSEFIESMPRSLRAASLAANPSATKMNRIIDAVETPFLEALTWK